MGNTPVASDQTMRMASRNQLASMLTANPERLKRWKRLPNMAGAPSRSHRLSIAHVVRLTSARGDRVVLPASLLIRRLGRIRLLVATRVLGDRRAARSDIQAAQELPVPRHELGAARVEVASRATLPLAPRGHVAELGVRRRLARGCRVHLRATDDVAPPLPTARHSAVAPLALAPLALVPLALVPLARRPCPLRCGLPRPRPRSALRPL